jgi:nanoRNase/pAp phosphatase (c-di-AMP/oligoRNAs hydrolase)
MDGQTPTPKQQTVERLKSAQNVVVTVGRQPTVDEVAAAIGLARMLTKVGKQVSAIISTPVPKVLKFLKPEAVVSTDFGKLRDLVIELDKEKADKLRYKAEKDVVKVFITPYKAALSEKDLRFSQGDYNADTVVVIGAASRDQLDKAILEHGRILQEATIVTLSVGEKAPNIGAVNWHEPSASSVSELLVSVADALQTGLLDSDISQALLAGIIAATDGFRGKATSPKVMTIAAQLMAGGADQQKIMQEFERYSARPAPAKDRESTESDKTTLEIPHEPSPGPAPAAPAQPPQPHMMMNPEVKPQPKSADNAPAHHHPRPDSPGDSRLAADSIDSLVASARQINAEMDRPHEPAPKSAAGLLSHEASAAESHINTHPKTPTLSPPPVAAVQAEEPPAHQRELDQAREAVAEAVAAHPEAGLPAAVDSLGSQTVPTDAVSFEHPTKPDQVA